MRQNWIVRQYQYAHYRTIFSYNIWIDDINIDIGCFFFLIWIKPCIYAIHQLTNNKVATNKDIDDIIQMVTISTSILIIIVYIKDWMSIRIWPPWWIDINVRTHDMHDVSTTTLVDMYWLLRIDIDTILTIATPKKDIINVKCRLGNSNSIFM